MNEIIVFIVGLLGTFGVGFLTHLIVSRQKTKELKREVNTSTERMKILSNYNSIIVDIKENKADLLKSAIEVKDEKTAIDFISSLIKHNNERAKL